ncbi:acyl-CoA dehydrogenase family protein [Streptomyces sp. NBC_01794]|uniref:acyl-CoA dehydrogenase family protein n=1 Tax=Streptomyces sp. NBC_01794 TaxID=2975942 RepID=UPI0030862116|nr:acyl-CoA dehydrogenase family protein [Streptomyces sp. NBC_01794]
MFAGNLQQEVTPPDGPGPFDARQRAAELVPLLRERAAQAEQLRQVPAESVKDLRASGLIGMVSPERFGGTGPDIDTAFAVSFELGRACGSTAWCYAVWTAHNWWLGHFPERCQEEYFATGPDTLFSGALNPANSTVERVAGGYRVSGRWGFTSGVDAADWVMVACGASPEERLWMLLPRTDYDIADTWFAIGLRGSGSKDVVARDVFVPEYRAINPNRAGDSDRTGWKLHQRASYRAPLKVFNEWALAAPVIGMAQGVVDEFTARVRRASGPRGAHSAALQLRLAEASAEVDTARTLHRAGVREILDRAEQGGSFPSIDRARYLRDASYTVNLCVRAVNRLYEASGARAIMDAEPIQRLYRDVHAASHHAALSWDTAAERYGRQALGLGD